MGQDRETSIYTSSGQVGLYCVGKAAEETQRNKTVTSTSLQPLFQCLFQVPSLNSCPGSLDDRL